MAVIQVITFMMARAAHERIEYERDLMQFMVVCLQSKDVYRNGETLDRCSRRLFAEMYPNRK